MRVKNKGFFLLSMILHELLRLTVGFNTLVETQMIGESRRNVIKNGCLKQVHEFASYPWLRQSLASDKCNANVEEE